MPSLVELGHYPPPWQSKMLRFFVTGSIARSAKCRYLSYSAGNFEVIRPASLTRYANGTLH